MIQENNFKNWPENELPALSWDGKIPMGQVSGVFGRRPLLERLKRPDIIGPGDEVLDLGCGNGYMSEKFAELVGPTGHVVGMDVWQPYVGLVSEKRPQATEGSNLEFKYGDITKDLGSFESESQDIITCLMVIHTLEIKSIDKMFKEAGRILKKGGRMMILTMHPELFNSEAFNLDFWQFDKNDLRKYQEVKDKEGVYIHVQAGNTLDKSRNVGMFHHTRENIINAAQNGDLDILEEQDLWIDPEVAKKEFKDDPSRVFPTKPAFWLITFIKK